MTDRSAPAPDRRCVPHLLLVCPRSDVLGKLLGLPVALSVVHRPGGDRAMEESLSLRVIDAEFTDHDKLLTAARDVHRWRPLDAILGLTELSLYPVSVVGQALGIRSNTPAAVGRAQDKAAMREQLAAMGVSTTAYQVCSSVEEARQFLTTCPTGMILKPVNGNGGSGVALVRDPAEVDAAWQWSVSSTGAWEWNSQSTGRPVLAEEFLTGREFSVETMSAAGRHTVLAVTGKHTTGSPHFVETGHDLPAPVPDAESAAIAQAAVDALDAIGYEWGPCHTEVMLAEDASRATVVEINVRQGGDQIWELVELVTGFDMITNAVATLATGEAPWGAIRARRGAAIRYLTPEPGQVVSVDGLDTALAIDGVIRVSELCPVGHVIPPLGDSWGRAGYVVASGPNAASAASAAEEAVSTITVKTVPPDA